MNYRYKLDLTKIRDMASMGQEFFDILKAFNGKTVTINVFTDTLYFESDHKLPKAFRESVGLIEE